MPITALTSMPDNNNKGISNRAFNGENKLFEFGPYSLFLVWKVDFIEISARLELRTASVADQLQQSPPVHGQATVTLSGTWEGIAQATVKVVFDTKTCELTIDGKLTYRNPVPPNVEVVVTASEQFKLC